MGTIEFVADRIRSLYSSGGVSEVLKGGLRYLQYRYPRVQVVIRTQVNCWKYGSAYPDPLSVVRIDPSNVRTYTDEFGNYQHIGAVQGGEWDQQTRPLNQHPKYQAVYQRFIEGKTWEETGIVEYMLAEIEKKGVVDSCTTEADVLRRYSTIDELYKSITKHGYRSHYAIAASDSGFESKVGYVIVNIGRDGELIFNGTGWHRLSIAKILSIETIPVIIGVRHKQWQTLRSRLHSSSSPTDHLQDAPELASHPDLRDLL